MSRLRRTLTGFASVLVCSLAVVGCAGVPESGSLHLGPPVAAAGSGADEGLVREVPAGPAPGASPVQLVSGFLRAMVDSDDGYAVARSYLVPDASWTATTRTTIYAGPVKIERASRDRVTVRARRVGVIAAHGSFRVAPGAVERTVAVTRRGREWRITVVGSGVLLSSVDAARLWQPESLYFLTPGGDRVVPQPVLEPSEQAGLATNLVRDLLAGPSPLLAPAVTTAVPRGTLLVGNVPISANGVAEVDLSSGAREITPTQLVRLSAQIGWTLRQLSSVTAVRLLANGEPLAAAGVPSLQPVRSWPQFDPADPPTTSGALTDHDGSVAALGGVVPPALRGRGLLDPVRSADGSVVAALRRTSTGWQLLVGDAGGPLRVRMHAATMSAPSVDPGDRVLVATARGLYAVGPSGPVRSVALPASLRGRLVRSLAVSRDGTRLALVVGAPDSALRVATITDSSQSVTVHRSRLVLPATDDVAGVAWSAADQLVTTTGGPRHERAVVTVGVDGYSVVDLSGPGLPSDVDQVAAAPGQPVLAADSSGTWRLGDQRWTRVSAGSAPSYAG